MLLFDPRYYLFTAGGGAINMNTTLSNELHPFKQYKLSQESSNVQRLVWICEMKRAMFSGDTKAIFEAKRDDQVKIMESTGISFEQIMAKANYYQCGIELVV